MDPKKIEKLEKGKYDSWLVSTIGITLILGIEISKSITGNYPIELRIIQAVGLVIVLVGHVWQKSVLSKIKSDEKIRKAINNELHTLHNYKSYAYGFWAFALSLLIVFLRKYINLDLDIDTICLIVLSAGILTKQISLFTFYYRK